MKRDIRLRSAMAVSVIAATLAAATITSRSDAALITVFSGNLNQAVPDGTYNGSLANMISSSVVVPSLAEPFIVSVSVEVAMDHTFVGDLVIHLQGPDGTIITLVNQPGFVNGPSGAPGIGGDSSNLSSLFPIMFADNAPSGISAELMGVGLLSSEVIGQIGPNNFIPFPDGANGNLTLGAFAGSLAEGTWTLYVGDAAAGASGVLSSWSLTLDTAIPGPGVLSLMGLAGLVLARRRRVL